MAGFLVCIDKLARRPLARRPLARKASVNLFQNYKFKLV